MEFSGNNFQSWPDFKLEISGLTVVIGPSNLGKSAIFRALKGLLRNEISERAVRNGQKNPIKLSLQVGKHNITATRSKSDSSAYVIDGEEFLKLAGAIPEEVKKLGYGEIKVGEFTVDPIFASQNEPQFLLDKKAYGPSLLNAILGAFGGTEKLEAGKKEANLRVTQKNGEAKTLSFEIAEANQRVATLDVLAAQGNAIAAEILTLESLSRRLEARAYWMTLAHQRQQRLSPMLELLAKLDLPDTSEVERLQGRVASLKVASAARGRATELQVAGQFLTDVKDNWSAIVGLYKRSRALQDIVPLLEARDASTATADAKALNAVIGQIEDIASEALRLQGSIKYIGQAMALRRRVAELQHERLHVEADQDAATKLKCPQCGAEF
jgi:DNA repair ATPase RecN